MAGCQTNVYLRFHVKQVTHSHVGIALAVAVPLREELVFGPGHVDPLGPSVSLVVYCGMRSCVPVMDELGLERRQRRDQENNNGCTHIRITWRCLWGREK